MSGEIHITVHRSGLTFPGAIEPLRSSLVLIREDLGPGNREVLADRDEPAYNGKPKKFKDERAVDPAQVLSLDQEAVGTLLEALGIVAPEEGT